MVTRHAHMHTQLHTHIKNKTDAHIIEVSHEYICSTHDELEQHICTARYV